MVQIGLLARYLLVISFSFNGIVTNLDRSILLAQTITEVKIPDRDPLLPPVNINRELSPLEKKRIRTEINSLEATANELLKVGKVQEAWQLWLRQLRLYRALGLTEEISALGVVGERAWQTNRKKELKAISDRLEKIYLEFGKQLDSRELIELGISARQIRNLDTASSIYKKLLKDARQQDSITLEEEYLVVLGEIYLNKFDYQQAEKVYRELLTLESNNLTIPNRDMGASSKFPDYSNQLIKIYDFLQQPEQSIEIKEKLIDYYLGRGDLQNIASLKIAVGDDYQTIEKLELAIDYYREAANISESEQQIALLNDSLQKSGLIYEKKQEYSLAIDAYQNSIEVSQKVGDSYSLMNNYDRLGNIYLILQDYELAAVTFSRGLEIAKTLDYRVEYFTNLLQQSEAENN